MKERQPSTRELRLVFKELNTGPLKGEGLLREIAIRFPGLATKALDQALEVHCEVLRCTGIRLEAEAHSMQALKDFLAQNMYADLSEAMDHLGLLSPQEAWDLVMDKAGLPPSTPPEMIEIPDLQ